MQLPAMVGKYELLEFLGGGMSHVYRGRDTIIERPVVVKLLTLDSCRNAEAKARFLQEARLAGNIQHENIVSVFDFGEHDGRPFIVMEHLKGEDLRDAIARGHTGSLLDRMKIALQIAGALEYVSGRGIVHRDVKPENVHIDANGRVKLMDFGIAKTEDLSLTKTGMTMGTPYYMAPEQVAGRPVTALADVYAYGLVFYELLTGVRAVNGDTIEAVLFQILNQPLDPAPMVNCGVPPPARELVLRCVAKNVEDRPQGFRLIGDELRALISGSAAGTTRPVEAKTLPMPVTSVAPAPSVVQARGQKSKTQWIALAVLLVLIATAGAFWFTRIRMPSAPPSIPGMIFIPAGPFLAGALNKSLEMHAFYIDETEVSNADFGAYCMAKGGCAAPQGEPDLPVVRVTIAQAREYAAWKGKRLPDSFEWERAARGTAGAKYPWGDAEDPSLANVAGRGLIPVKSFKPYPAYQMAGNVWEMVETKSAYPSPQAVEHFATLLTPAPTADEKWIAIRGGSFNTPLSAALGYEFSPVPERYSSSDIGFRCARSAP